jgi:hypothetical protein
VLRPAKNKPKPKPKPNVSTLIGGDASYQQGLSELQRVMNQFRVSNADSQADVRTAFATASERMAAERKRAQTDISDDFGARGLMRSGMSVKAKSDYNTEYNNRVTDLTRDKQNTLSNLASELTNFQGLNTSRKQELRLDAINRRAAKTGVRSF